MKSGCLYKNRRDAGEQLAQGLEKYKHQNVIVIGIPRGGVEIGYYVAKYLQAELSILISRKIPHPLHPEYGIGAIAEGNTLYVPKYISLNRAIINIMALKVKQEIRRRILIYHKEKPLPDLTNRIVILVDDGIATGVTLVPAIRCCKKMQAKKVIIAAPVSGKKINEDLYEADELKILHQTENFESVGEAYEDFSQLNDKDVLSFLTKYSYQ